jgi:CheY-like chemotaxis protein
MSKLKKILLVDDNPKDVELAMEALAAANLASRVVIANDGIEALEYLQYKGVHQNRKIENPAVILMDIKMPRMDGIEALQAIREDPALGLIPVVMLTSSQEEPDLSRCYDLGVNAYVVKPVHFDDFYRSVRQLGIFWGLFNEPPPDRK